MSGFDVDKDQTTNFKNKLLRVKRERSWVKALFEVYRRLYFRKNFGEKSIYKQRAKAIFEASVWCFQIIALIWIPNLPIKNWSGNIFIWEIVGYLRFDNTCAELAIIGECLYVSMFMVFLIFLGMLVLVICKYKSIDIPAPAFTLFKRIFYFWLTLFFIPSITLFSIFEKYNFLPHDTVLEYHFNNGFKNFEISSALQTNIVFMMIISFFLLLLYTEFSGEIRHFAIKRTLKAKGHSRIDRHAAIFMYFLPILYAMLAENNIVIYQILVMLVSLTLMVESIKFLPYFSKFYNSIMILKFFVIAFVSFIFLLGYWLDNSLSIILFAIILLPIILACFLYYIIKMQIGANTIIPNDLIHIDSQYKLEKAIRYALCNNDIDNKDQIIRLFELFFMALNRGKLQIIWEANYCLFTLKDESLAKAKLSKIKTILDWNWEVNYQAYICKQNIENSYMSESSNFLSLFHQLNWIKRKDKKLCGDLLKFWKEVVSKKPIMNRLITQLKAIDKRVVLLSNEYSQIITKFSNSRESLELYASYTRNILYDIEKSIMLDNKLRYFDRLAQSSTIDIKQANFFNDTNGIIIFSNEEENFGEILFTNPSAIEILKSTSDSIIGNSISNFIPPYYRKIFIEKSKWFTHFGSNSEISLDDGFFIYLPTNFILECTGKASITAINHFIITVLAFKVKQVTHQIALISENCEILCHSENFAELSRNDQSNLEGLSLRSILKLEISNLNPFTPYNLVGLQRDIVFVFAYFEFNDIKIPYILLISDPEEMHQWKEKGFNGDFSYDTTPTHSKRIEKTFEIIEIPLNLPTTPALQGNKELSYDSDCRLIFNEADNNSDLHGDFSSEKIDEKSVMSQHTSLRNFINTTKIFSRAINILHGVFVLSIIIVISTNIAVLFYAFSSINLVSDMSLPLTIGNVGKNLQYAAYLAKTVLVLSYPGAGTRDYAITTLEGLKAVLIELDNLHSYVTSNLTDWTSCSGSNYFTDKNINLWYVDYNVYMEKTSLLDTVTKFIQIGNGFIRKFNNSEDITKEASFMVLSGYGEAFHYCNSSLYDIIECQQSGISDFKTKMLILLVLSLAVLGACVLIMTPFCYSTLKIENNLWNSVRKSACRHYLELTQSIVDRLANTHHQDEIPPSAKHLSKKSFILKNYPKYVWRISVYFIIVLVFSIVNISYFYEKCAEYLSYRPEVIRELINSQTLYTSLGIWTTEVSQDYAGTSVKYILYYALPFIDNRSALQLTIEKIQHSEHTLRNPKYCPIKSKKFNQIFHENIYNYPYPDFRFGVYSAGEITMYEATAIIYLLTDYMAWTKFINVIASIDNYYSQMIDEVNHYSKSVIDDQIHLIIAILIVFIVISLIMYFVMYLRFFRKEKKYLTKINSIMKIMP
ncbi:unnamed protein product [Blepharisma stoltei]|uniref:TmcB/TmcC TPR repeats domain-containing protein n=1 Tax=Blepharisma stoltei TaxID=1481888 RepID=A0AAU9JAJ2_9CILI|nr:unnamed protein product [Blepharisma stoltei]